jgi:hypothetical protein
MKPSFVHQQLRYYSNRLMAASVSRDTVGTLSGATPLIVPTVSSPMLRPSSQ